MALAQHIFGAPILLAVVGSLLFLPVRALAHGAVHEQIKALTTAIEAGGNQPTNAPLLVQRGNLHRIHSDWALAAADFDKAAQLDPTLAEVDIHRARMWLEASQPEKSLAAIERYCKSRPENGDALLLRARARVQLGESLAAAADFARVIHLKQEKQPELFIEHAEALASAGGAHREEALRSLDEAITKLGPLMTLELPALDLELALQRHDAALARVDFLLSRVPRKEGWLCRRGEILLQAARTNEARTAFTHAWDAFNKLPPNHRNTPAMANLEVRIKAALESLAQQPQAGPTK